MTGEMQEASYQYLDFDIEITKGDGDRYPVAVHSKGGDANESIAFPFDVNELSRYLDKLQIALLRSAKTHRTLSDEEVIVREFGEKLFRALFTQQIRSCYDRSMALAQAQGKGLRIRLDIEADELAGLPWEFLFDPEKDDYLCLSAHTPVVRYLDCGQVIPPMEVQPPLQVLGMISSPADLDPLDVAQEKANLEKALAPLIQEGLAKLTWLEDGSWRALLDALNGGPWHIFHFVGHGDYNEEKKEGIVAFEGTNKRAQYISAGQLARLLGEHSYLRVVILNSCESAQSGKEDIFSSTAATLIKRGVPAVIAMQYSITDTAAIEISQTFYKSLAAGLPVDAAISRARLALSFAVNNTLEWGTPVLLMRTEDGVLFNLKLPQEAALAAKNTEKESKSDILVLQSSARQAIEDKDWLLARGQIAALQAAGVEGQAIAAELRSQLDAAHKAQSERINQVQQEVNQSINTYQWVIAGQQLDQLTDEGVEGQAAVVELQAQISDARQKQAGLISKAKNRAELAIQAKNLEAVENIVCELNALGEAGRMAAKELPLGEVGPPAEALQVGVRTLPRATGQPQSPGFDDAANARMGKILKWGGIGTLAVILLIILCNLASRSFDENQSKLRDTYFLRTAGAKTALATSYTRTPTQVSSIMGTVTPGPLGIVPPILSPIDGMTLIYVPSGTFQMGSDSGGTDEWPVHTVTLDAFWIDRTEVTNAQFVDFLNKMGNRAEGGNTWLMIETYKRYGHILEVDEVWQVDEGYADHPATGVTWYGARAYCAWAGRVLPSEAQWEYVAHGTDSRTFPWGEGINCSLANYAGCVGDTAPAGSYLLGASPFGVLDMAGNVSEWVMDWYQSDYYYDSPGQNPQGPDTGEARVLRGGNWESQEYAMRGFDRGSSEPNDVPAFFVGFRCARPVAVGEVLQPTVTGIPTFESTTVPSPTLLPLPTYTESPTLEPTRSRLPTPTDYDFTTYMVRISAGYFLMGEIGNGDHEVNLDEFFIDRYEVTNAQFASFLNVSGNQWEGGSTWLDSADTDVKIIYKDGRWQAEEDYADHPVVEVTWYGARAYCEWVAGRLPTEAEWEKAARGGDKGYLYPWGDYLPACTPETAYVAQTKDTLSCGSSGTTTVHMFEPNKFGLFNMLGNVWEWVNDWYMEGYYTISPDKNPPGPETGDERVVRGGSWSNYAQYTPIHIRLPYNPVESTANFGFRCAHDP